MAAGVALAALGAGGLVHEEIQAAELAEHQAAQQHQLNRARMMPASPQDWVRIVHDTVAREGDEDHACWMLAEPVRPRFAAAHHAPDCATAMRKLGGLIANRGLYSNPRYDYDQVIRVDGDRVTLDLCRVYWQAVSGEVSQPGPLLGRFELERVLPGSGEGYQAVGWQPCPAAPTSATATPPGPAVSTTAAAPPAVVTTTAVEVRLLPSYPPAYPAVILKAVARRDTAVCELFTDAGRAAFAAAFGVAGCADAVNALADRVTDPAVYGDPQPTSVSATTVAGGRQAVVDACHLQWRTAGGVVTPGPQLGFLGLVLQPAGTSGYLVDGFTGC